MSRSGFYVAKSDTLVNSQALCALTLDRTYQLYGREFISAYGGLKSVRLVAINKTDPNDPMYTFEDRDDGTVEAFDANRFPTMFTDKNSGVKTIVFECIDNGRTRKVEFSQAKKEKYEMDVGQTNIVFATGKPAKYTDHLKITPEVNIAKLLFCMSFVLKTNASYFIFLAMFVTGTLRCMLHPGTEDFFGNKLNKT